MKYRILFPIAICFALGSFLLSESKSIDLYKVLGVERDASQRQIQKAFHKLSLQYHPDKNQNKGAQEKFAEINNAYDILSDEEKRKNYDLYGDEKGNPRFESGNPGGHGGYTHFTSGGAGNSHTSFDPSEWKTTGGQGNSQSFSFSFGDNPSASGSSFGFDVNDIFSNLFGGGMGGGSQFGGSSRTRSRPASSKTIQAVNSLVFKNEILDRGITWILLTYVPSSKGYHVLESIVEEVAGQLQGALKAGSINCQKDQSLCKELGLHSPKSAQVFVYSYKASDKGTVAEYNGGLEAKGLKSFCQNQLPRFSSRVDVGHLDFTLTNVENLPRVLLLSTKKDTPVIWRALSGLYRRRIMFYDAEVHDVFDPAVKSLGVDVLPAVVGWFSNGEKYVLKNGITVKDLKSAISELSGILDKFEKINKKSKKTGSSQPKSPQQTDRDERHLPLLTNSNLDTVCGESTPVCVIGAFRSSNGKDKLESILSTVSKKSLTRRQNQVSGSGDSVSFSLLDANKQQEFLDSMDKTRFKSKDNSLVAYKPRKGKFAAFTNELTLDEVERFIGAVLNGDVQFSKIKRKPVLK